MFPCFSWRWPDSLLFRLNGIIAIAVGTLALSLAWQQLDATRASVREEITAANRVATQLLERTGWIVVSAGPQAMLGFLEQLGRVRANDIQLMDAQGRVLYRSPQPTYKQGRSVPTWFHDLVAPVPQRQVIPLPGGALLSIEADPSRAILDGWDDLTQLALQTALALGVLLSVVFAAVSHLVRPLAQVEQALARLEQGDYATRLPTLPGREARLIGAAVNRLGEAIEATLSARIQAIEAERSLARSRDWAQEVEARLEAERKEIAAMLHDELGQSVTGIRSLARSLALRLPAQDATGRQAAMLIDQEASRLYEAMHGLIPRLTPLSLGPLGLAEALGDLVATLRPQYPAVQLHAELAPDPAKEDAGPACWAAHHQPALLAAYRVAQEALTNAFKHSGAQHITLRLSWPAGAQVCVQVEDDGRGLPDADQRPTRFGLLGLRERVLALGGVFEAERRAQGGSRVQAILHVPT